MCVKHSCPIFDTYNIFYIQMTNGGLPLVIFHIADPCMTNKAVPKALSLAKLVILFDMF